MTSNHKKVELLAPAGSLECFEAALRFGADAVYLAGKQFGLRASAANFDDTMLQTVIECAHARSMRVYVTVNALLYNDEIADVEVYLKKLAQMGADAVIISDPGIVELCKAAGLEIHISTQMSTMNYASASFWHKQGASRVVMAREASLEEIAYIHAHTPESLELEAFVHGAMCIAHSGRCLLSTALTGRSGNRGACAQPCRWEFTLHEQGYPNEYFPITEDERGTYILNSKDLMMLEYIPELIQSGISSLKIEGRMKSAYYVASVVSAYRHAIDAYYANPEDYAPDHAYIKELEECATRGFTTGFYFDKGVNATDTHRDTKEKLYKFCGVALEASTEDGMVWVEQRNKFSVGDTLCVLTPADHTTTFIVSEIVNEAGDSQLSAPHPQQKICINCPVQLAPGDMLRLKLKP